MSVRFHKSKRPFRHRLLALALLAAAPAAHAADLPCMRLEGGSWVDDPGASTNQGLEYGNDNSTCRPNSVALGRNNQSNAFASSTMGMGNQAYGNASSAVGYYNVARGSNSTAHGGYNFAPGQASTAVGYFNEALGLNAVAAGALNHADGLASLAIGTENNTAAVSGVRAPAGDYSTALGYRNQANGVNAAALGYLNQASLMDATAVGQQNIARGVSSVALGYRNLGSSLASVAVGFRNQALGEYAGAFGAVSSAEADWSYALGMLSRATATGSVALGYQAVADRAYAIAVGSAGGEHQIIHLAAGSADTDAANLGQVRALAAALGGGAGYGGSGSFLVPGFSVQGSRYTTVADALAALDGWISSYAGGGSGGGGGGGGGDAGGGSGLVVEYDDASGSSLSLRGTRISQVANAVAADEAVNLGQMQAGDDATLATARSHADSRAAESLAAANAYTDARFAGWDDQLGSLRRDVDRRFSHLDARIDRMGAMGSAMAAAALNTAGLPGPNRLGVGVGVQGGRTALGVGYQRLVAPNASISLSGAFAGSERAFSAGAGLSW